MEIWQSSVRNNFAQFFWDTVYIGLYYLSAFMCMAYIYNAYMLMYMLLYVSLIRISVINHIKMLSRGVARVAASAAAVVMVKHLDCISSIVTWIQYPTDRVECLTCRQRLLRSCETESERETERVTEGDRERHTQSERDRHTTRDNKSHFTLLSSLLLVLRWSFSFNFSFSILVHVYSFYCPCIQMLFSLISVLILLFPSYGYWPSAYRICSI